MRIPIAVSLESRDGLVTKDAKILNGLIENMGGVPPLLKVRKRPGMADVGQVHNASGQLLYSWNGIQAILGDSLYSGNVSTIVGATGTALSPTNASLAFYASETSPKAATPRLFIHNRTQAWTVTRAGAASAVTFGNSMGATTYNLISLTRVSNTATATLADTVFQTGDSVVIAGAVQANYNGTFTVTAYTAAVAASNIPVTITRSGTTATATTVSGSAHGLTTATAYTMAGADQSEYNGSKTITTSGGSTFTFTVSVTSETPASPATGSPIVATWNDGTCFATSRSGTTLTLSTPAGNTVSNGESITLASTWPGTYTVFNRSAGSYQITVSNSGPTSTSGTFYVQRTPTVSISSITRAAGSATATVTMSGTHSFGSYDLLTFSGATQSGYNVSSVSISSTGATTFTYTTTFVAEAPATPGTGSITVAKPAVNATFSYAVAGSPTTPATGTITAAGTGGMVPGVAYINGYHVVMDTNANINNSASDDPTSFPALSATAAQAVNGAGKAIARSNSNYLLAFKEWSTEFFYDAKNATGSPFSPVEPAFILIGCATGDSLSDVDGLVVWMSQVKQLGRSVHLMDGLQATKISTPDVERILNADSLVTVYAYGVKFDGHALYILTLVASNITLVFDMHSKTWSQWSSLALGSPLTVSSITWDGDVATVTTSAAHGMSDGAPVNIAGAAQTDYNGIFPAMVLTTTTFAVQVPGSPVTPATGTITATPYTETYFKLIKYANYQGTHLFLHETNGHLYQPTSTLFQDAGVPIRTFGRSVRIDGGTLDTKKMPRVRVVGDSVDDLVLVRWSDDDSQSFSAFRRIDLSDADPNTDKCGPFRRRSLEFVHVGNNPINLSHYEPTISK